MILAGLSVFVVVDTFAVWRLGQRRVVRLMPTAIINFAVAAAAAAAAAATDMVFRPRQDVKVYILPEWNTPVRALGFCDFIE